MKVCHGTTFKTAEKIVRTGFFPKDGLVWLAKRKSFARCHSVGKAIGKRNQPIVLTCDIDLKKLRNVLGEERVILRGKNVITVNAPISAKVLQSYSTLHLLHSVESVTAWAKTFGINVDTGDGLQRIDRLARWIRKNLTTGNREVHEAEFLRKVKQWLPELYKQETLDFLSQAADSLIRRTRWNGRKPVGVFVWGGEVGMETLRKQAGIEVERTSQQLDRHEEEVLDCLTAESPDQRIRGLN